MPKRKVRGAFYAHGGQVFAVLDTDQPFDLPGCGALMRSARRSSSPQLGNIQLKLVEDARFPELQAFVIMSDRKRADRPAFERMVKALFPECTLTTEWVTNFAQHDGQLLYALLAREIVQQR